MVNKYKLDIINQKDLNLAAPFFVSMKWSKTVNRQIVYTQKTDSLSQILPDVSQTNNTMMFVEEHMDAHSLWFALRNAPKTYRLKRVLYCVIISFYRAMTIFSEAAVCNEVHNFCLFVSVFQSPWLRMRAITSKLPLHKKEDSAP